MAEARDRSPLWVGKILHDKWSIEAEIGRGGVATVFRAKGPDGRLVAIKIIHPELARNEEVRRRFLREGRTANTVDHPCVVRVLDEAVTDAGVAYIVMELLGDGELLEDWRERAGGRIPAADAVDVGIQVLDVLAAAHEKGIIHRDIKPENVFVLSDGTAKVLDFGIAHIKDAVTAQEATATGLLLGTPEYMAPEQALGKRGQIDAQTDIFALGATMFTLLSGESVHPCETMTALLVAVASRQARSLASTQHKDLPRELVTVIDKALGLEKARRWPSARAMQQALRAVRPGLGAEKARPEEAPSEKAPAEKASEPKVPEAKSGEVRLPGLKRASLPPPPSKLPFPAPPPRVVRPAAKSLRPAPEPVPPSFPPSSDPTAIMASFPVRAPTASAPDESFDDPEDLPTQTKLPSVEDLPTHHAGAHEAAREQLPSNPWTDELSEGSDLHSETVAMVGAPALPAPSDRVRLSAPPVTPTSTASLPMAPPLAPPHAPLAHSPSPFAAAPLAAPPPFTPQAWPVPGAIAPPHAPPIPFPLPPPPRAKELSPVLVAALAFAAFLLVAIAIGSCLFLRAR